MTKVNYSSYAIKGAVTSLLNTAKKNEGYRAVQKERFDDKLDRRFFIAVKNLNKYEDRVFFKFGNVERKADIKEIIICLSQIRKIILEAFNEQEEFNDREKLISGKFFGFVKYINALVTKANSHSAKKIANNKKPFKLIIDWDFFKELRNIVKEELVKKETSLEK